MLQIGYLVICEDVIQEKDHVNIQRPMIAITPISLPGNYSFKVAFSLYNLDQETFGSDNFLRVVFTDPKGNTVIDTDQLHLTTDSKNRPKEARLEGADASVNLNNIELLEKGLHTLSLTVNEQTKELKIPVFEKLRKGELDG